MFGLELPKFSFQSKYWLVAILIIIIMVSFYFATDTEPDNFTDIPQNIKISKAQNIVSSIFPIKGNCKVEFILRDCNVTGYRKTTASKNRLILQYIKDSPRISYEYRPGQLYTIIMLKSQRGTNRLNSLMWMVCNIPEDNIAKGETLASYLPPFCKINNRGHIVKEDVSVANLGKIYEFQLYRFEQPKYINGIFEINNTMRDEFRYEDFIQKNKLEL